MMKACYWVAGRGVGQNVALDQRGRPFLKNHFFAQIKAYFRGRECARPILSISLLISKVFIDL